jgi:hypothetical protein
MFASKCSGVVLTITKPRFCIWSGQVVLTLTIGQPNDKYGKCRRDDKLIRRLGVKYLLDLDSLSIIHELHCDVESY